jgi:hypothetical protein
MLTEYHCKVLGVHLVIAKMLGNTRQVLKDGLESGLVNGRETTQTTTNHRKVGGDVLLWEEVS